MSDSENNQLSNVGVLLLHGLTGVPAEMRPLAKHLEKLGCEVSVPMLEGHGAGHQELLDTSWQDWVAGARRALNDLHSRNAHVFVGGLSMGSSIACILAADDPKVAGFISLSTTLRFDGETVPLTEVLLPLVDIFPFLGTNCYWTESPPYGLKDERLQRIITRSVERAKNGETSDFGLFRTYAGSVRQMSHLVHEVRRKAQAVTCPTVIIHSLEDTMTSIDNASELYSRLQSRDKVIQYLTDCDHVLTLDLKKEKVAQLVGDFIARIAADRNKVAQTCSMA
ncbi:MAG: alpha/beta fold hydrolase [Candidatus Obscuribacterales bacterium]|nr:alpha/beta fold hydrolase [Candidatus Obscuribacterales bacterium]